MAEARETKRARMLSCGGYMVAQIEHMLDDSTRDIDRAELELAELAPNDPRIAAELQHFRDRDAKLRASTDRAKAAFMVPDGD